MNTEFDGDDEGSSRGNCVLIASEPKREQDRTALGSQPPRQNSAYLRGLHPIGQKNRTCIGSHPWRAEARILAEKTSYVRRSGFRTICFPTREGSAANFPRHRSSLTTTTAFAPWLAQSEPTKPRPCAGRSIKTSK